MARCDAKCSTVSAAGALRARKQRLSGVLGSVGLALMAGATPAAASDVVISPLETHQTIDGFGASSAWTTQNLSDSDADFLFSTTAADGGAPGIGMSLLRIRAAPDGTTLETGTALKAQARGVKVWATPWSPPSEWKVGTDDAGNGGSLDGGQYGPWADRLVLFLQNMHSAGINIVALSAQNEPDHPAVNTALSTGYESCVYTPANLSTFIGHYLGPALIEAGVTPQFGIVGPETQGWSDFSNFEGPILNDPQASQYIGIVATHEYNGSPSPYDVGSHRFWETEVSQLTGTVDPGMGSGLWMANTMHNALVEASVNAWSFWWIHPASPDNAALYSLTANGALAPAKRLYVMGNYSRFVRPGFTRVGTAPAAQLADSDGNYVYTSAYCGAATGDAGSCQELVVVAINNSASPQTQTFQFSGVTTTSWQSWVTSDTLDLMPGDPIAGTGPVTYTLAPTSVTTLVGEVTGPGDLIVPDGGAIGADGGLPSGGDVVAGNDGCGLACSTVGGMSDRNGAATAIGASALAALAAAFRVRTRRRRSRRSNPS